MDLPNYNGSTERDGINLVDRIVTHDIGWIFREQPIRDFGIDAHIEIVENKLVTGKLLAVQIKSGPSYLSKKTKEGFIYLGKMKHLNYWNNHSLPVILILCDVDQEKCYWVQIKKDKVRVLKNSWKIIVPFIQVINVNCKRQLETIAEKQTDYERRLHSLILARPWMEEIVQGNKVIIESDEWINKTSGRGSIKLKVIDPYTCEETIVLDYPMLFLGMISYEEAFKKYFPWAEIAVDEEFYEDYDENDYLTENAAWDSEDEVYIEFGNREEWRKSLPSIRPYEIVSGEVARYRLELFLNEIGKSFLLIDDYLRTGIHEGSQSY